MGWMIFLALIMGCVEGLTEFLPVSSTAHLIVAGDLLGFDDPTGSFKIMIQLGAILAVIVLYFPKIWGTVQGLADRPDARQFALSIVAAFIPSLVAGLFLGDLVEKVFLDGQTTPEAWRIIAATFILGGVAMLAVERYRPPPREMQADAVPLWKSFAIGCVQTLALIPGVSRSGATVLGGLIMGLERRAAAEFSFFLAMPTMVAAFVYSFMRHRDDLDISHIGIIAVGFVAAFASALVVVKPFLNAVGRHGFGPFALYRIALGLVVLFTLGLGA